MTSKICDVITSYAYASCGVSVGDNKWLSGFNCHLAY